MMMQRDTCTAVAGQQPVQSRVAAAGMGAALSHRASDGRAVSLRSLSAGRRLSGPSNPVATAATLCLYVAESVRVGVLYQLDRLALSQDRPEVVDALGVGSAAKAAR